MTPYRLQCNPEIFTKEEVRFLTKHGKTLSDLANRKTPPKTKQEAQFVKAAQGKSPPKTIIEVLWTTYIDRIKLEANPSHRAIMGPPTSFPCDREACRRSNRAIQSENRNRWRD